MDNPTQNNNYLPLAQLVDYRIIEAVYSGSRTLVYRAIRIHDQLPVVIKLLRNDYPTFSEITQFRNQYSITKKLNSPHIVQTYSLEPYQNGYGLVMEDFGGISLQSWDMNGRNKLSLLEFLKIAIDLCNILNILYQARIIHKDIKPSNILINPETKQVKLIDFSIASLLPRETQTLLNPNVLEGTLAYISPEQTGRMNRGIDYRTDYYSLGVTFYELLTGELPFQSNDPMELVHSHIAKSAPLVHETNSEIPPIISKIVSKLMAKNAEDRYQNALGLRHDLEICSHQLQENGKITSFEIAQRDISDRFLIPDKLYGREQEVETLLQAFERVSLGATEMMLVAGFSGIGKTAVINEVHKPITRQNGYFVKGKFDQFNRNIPLSAFVQALRDLMGQLFSKSDANLAEWKAQIMAAVGENGQVLIEVIPELEQIIGQQPPAPELSGSAAQNRFNLLFQRFIEIFTTAEHPLVLFLDDLQWADLASLQLVKLLMNDSQNNSGYLLILGAYRDNEVSPVHPFMLMLEELKQAGAIANTITLLPLAFADTNHLIADTLNCSVELAQPLTELINRKTQGNPFFTTQFLKALHEDGHIYFTPHQGGATGGWQCDIAQVNALAITDDVVEFMAVQLQKLSDVTQQVLKLAACVGNQFDLDTLAIVSERSPIEAATALWKALQEGLILPTSQVYKFFQGADQTDTQSDANPSYRFLHDRVQQAAYSLIPETEKSLTHWKIGQLLLRKLSKQQQEDKIFDLVNQLNLGKTTISGSPEQLQLAQLNLQAGKKAKLSAAHQAAQTYCEIGIDLLPPRAWQTDYELSYNLYRHGSEAAYLSGNFDQAEALYPVALERAQTPLDKAVIYRVQMTQYHLQGRNTEAITIQRQSLEFLGWTIPVEPENIQASLNQQIAIVDRFLEQQTIESILDFAKMENDTIAETLRILQILYYAAWFDAQSTLALLALAKMTTLSLQYGNSDMSPFGYVGYGLIANTVLKNADQAYQFGNMAVQLCEQFENVDVQGMTNFLFAADVHSWSRPLREADTYYENAFKFGMDAGNWLTVSYTMMQSDSDRLTYGKNLNDLHSTVQAHAAFLHQIKSLENLLAAGLLQPIRNLLGLTKTPLTFDDDNFSEAEYLQKYGDVPFNLAWYYVAKIRHVYLFEQRDLYSDLISQLSLIENTIPSHAKVPSSVFYVALMHLALIDIANKSQRQFHWQAILPLEERLNRWAVDCPANIRHKCLLIQSEKARLKGQKAEAIEFYDRAIAGAKENGYIQEEALANELAAKFYLGWSKEKIATAYMQEAYYCYAHWGAKAKTDNLEKCYPQLLNSILQQSHSRLSTYETIFSLETVTSATSATSGSSISVSLDLAAILKASQTISGEIELEKLLTSLLSIVIENAGANKCVLMLLGDDSLWGTRGKGESLLIEGAITLGMEPVVLQSLPVEESRDIPLKLINKVKHDQQTVMLIDVSKDITLANDPYIVSQQPKSILCSPILYQGQLMGILYLENNLVTGAFTSDRVELLNLICTQAAISLENARLYEGEQQKSQALEKALNDLQNTQLQLVQGEKMSALGNLVAGVAHEMNNPLGFISASLKQAKPNFDDIFEHLRLYQEKFPSKSEEIIDHESEIDLEYSLEDLPKMINSMMMACDRLKNISTSLRTFSRADRDYKVPFDLPDGIDSTILILKHRLKANDQHPEIEVIINYGNTPAINCFPGQLNQVFMNILANAIDALDESNQGRSYEDITEVPNRITINTFIEDNNVKIIIKDNGIGMPEKIKNQIFDHLFTTKEVGKGTGLGLAIARQIIEEKHQGTISVNSILDQGTEFIITLPISAS